VLSELKLTETLAGNLNQVKAQVEDLLEKLEVAQVYRNYATAELQTYKNKYTMQKKQLNLART